MEGGEGCEWLGVIGMICRGSAEWRRGEEGGICLVGGGFGGEGGRGGGFVRCEECRRNQGL